MSFVDMDSIKAIVKGMQKPRRFHHTLGVENEARKIGEIFLPNKVDKLAIAGVLHDITKDFSTEQHLKFCEEYGITVDKKISPKLLHAITGCEFARRKFGKNIVDDEIYDGIKFHTVGRENMSLFEQIVYLADYIEENRTFEDCRFLRTYFYSNLSFCKNEKERHEVLRKTMLLSFDLTIRNLLDEEKRIDFDTIKARNYFLTTL